MDNNTSKLTAEQNFKERLNELIKMYITDGEPILIHKAWLAAKEYALLSSSAGQDEVDSDFRSMSATEKDNELERLYIENESLRGRLQSQQAKAPSVGVSDNDFAVWRKRLEAAAIRGWMSRFHYDKKLPYMPSEEIAEELINWNPNDPEYKKWQLSPSSEEQPTKK